MTDFIVNPRRSPRAPTRCRVRVQTTGGSWDSETEDVGPSGCQLVAPAPLPRGAPLQLLLLAPGVKDPLRAGAKVAWVSSQEPWRLGVAFEEPSRPAAGRWFDLLLAARPGLAAFRRVPDRLPLDAMVFLGAPPRFADFSDDEVLFLRHVAGGATIANLKSRLEERWPRLQRVLFALLSRGALTVSRGAAAHPEVWRPIMAELGVDFEVDTPVARPPPQALQELVPHLVSDAEVEAWERGEVTLPDPSDHFVIERVRVRGSDDGPLPTPAPAGGPPAMDAPSLPPLRPQPAAAAVSPRPAGGPVPAGPPPGAPPGQASAGTGWRGTTRGRTREADEQLNLGRAELELGNLQLALDHFRQALQLAPGDPEVAVELGRAMRR